MKLLLFKTGALSLFVAMLFFGRAFAGEDEHALVKEIDGLKVQLSFMDETVKTGNNDLIVAVTGNDGKPIAGAKVLVTAEMAGDMAGMAGMAGMEGMQGMAGMKPPETLSAEPQTGHGEGQYMTTLKISDIGDWTIKLKITAGGRERAADFVVHAVKAGPNWHVILGFLGVITTIITVAGLNKIRKTARR